MIHQQPSARAALRRRAILEHTAGLVASHGYHRVRVADIARRCGTSTATIHYYFPRRQDLLDAALEHSFDRAFERQRQALRGISGARDRLEALINLQLPVAGVIQQEWAIWVQIWAESVVTPALRDAHQRYYDRWFASVVALIARGQSRGEFRSGNPENTARLITSLIDGAGIASLTGVSSMSHPRLRELLHAAVESLLPAPDPAGPGALPRSAPRPDRAR